MQLPNEKVQKDKQWSTKQYTENYRVSNTNPINSRGWTRVFSNGSSTCSILVPNVLLLNNANVIWYGNRVGHLFT